MPRLHYLTGIYVPPYFSLGYPHSLFKVVFFMSSLYIHTQTLGHPQANLQFSHIQWPVCKILQIFMCSLVLALVFPEYLFPLIISSLVSALLHRSTQYPIAVIAIPWNYIPSLFSHQVHMDSLCYHLPFSLFPLFTLPSCPLFSFLIHRACSLWLIYVWIPYCDLCIYLYSVSTKWQHR